MFSELSEMLSNPALTQGTMTPRDIFAAAIVVGMHANPELMQHVTSGSMSDGSYAQKMAATAYKFANALMEEKKKNDSESLKDITAGLGSIFKAAADSRD